MEHEHVKLNAIAWFDVPGRGMVALVDLKHLPAGRKLLAGDSLYIDDKLFACRGIEGNGSNIAGLVVEAP
jgi:hypothetical protein